MKRYFILALIGLVFGCLTGFLGVWLDHLSEGSAHPSAIVDLSGLVVLFPSLPGSIIAQFHWDYDWCIDEAWDYRWAITFFNGIFWMIFIPACSFYMYLARCLPHDVKLAYQKWKQARSDRQNT
jgi:hypothetical protein